MELPSVAVFRKRRLHALAESIEALGRQKAGGGGGRGGGGGGQSGDMHGSSSSGACSSSSSSLAHSYCQHRKLAWDVLNKIIFRGVSDGGAGRSSFSGASSSASSSVAAAAADDSWLWGAATFTTATPPGVTQAPTPYASSADEHDSNGAWVDFDPVLPPYVPIESLAAQIGFAYPRARVSLTDVGSLAREFAEAARATSEEAARQRKLWRMRIDGGRNLSDRTLHVTCHAHPTDVEMYQLRWVGEQPRGSSGGGSDSGEVETVDLWRSHVESLRASHRRVIIESNTMRGLEPSIDASLDAQLSDGLVLSHIFSMAVRYDAISEYKHAYQAALPEAVMDLLQVDLQVHHECYASPLNRRLPAFCSAFPDTDRHFGSRGSFFDFWPTAGSYECNPPFDNRSINACLEHVLRVLEHADGLPAGGSPLSFVVTVPTITPWGKDDHSLKALSRLSPYLREAIQVEANQHGYHMGQQHKRAAHSTPYWKSSIPSTAYFLANAAGSARWPLRDAFRAELISAWKV